MTEATLADRVIRTDVEIQAVARDGQIHILLSERDQHDQLRAAYASNAIISVDGAMKLAKLLADLALQEETGGLRVPDALKQELVSRHRKTLLDRLTVMLNSSREKKTISNRSLAQLMVDAMSKEVFS